MSKIFLQEAEEVRLSSEINLVVDDDIIKNKILVIQQLYIGRSFPKHIYTTLLEQYMLYVNDINNQWEIEEYSVLLNDYIRPAITQYCLSELSLVTFIDSVSGDNMEKMELKMDMLKELHLSKYQDYIELANEYIEENAEIFLSADEDYVNSKSTKRVGIGFPTRNKNYDKCQTTLGSGEVIWT